MRRSQGVFLFATTLLVAAAVLSGCGVNPSAQAEPGGQPVILPTPPPMPTSAPVPPTATPPAAPAAAANAAGAQALFSADFTKAADIAKWSVVDQYAAAASPSVWQVVDGRLAQVSDGDGGIGQYPTALIAGPLTSNNYRASVSAYNTGNDEIGLVFRASSQGFYVFRVRPSASSSSKYVLSRFDAAQSSLTDIAKADGAGFEFGKWAQLGISVQGDHIQAFFDGKPVLEVNDATFAQGSVGVFGYAQGQLAFDNLSVQALGNN